MLCGRERGREDERTNNNPPTGGTKGETPTRGGLQRLHYNGLNNVYSE